MTVFENWPIVGFNTTASPSHCFGLAAFVEKSNTVDKWMINQQRHQYKENKALRSSVGLATVWCRMWRCFKNHNYTEMRDSTNDSLERVQQRGWGWEVARAKRTATRATNFILSPRQGWTPQIGIKVQQWYNQSDTGVSVWQRGHLCNS